MKNFSIVIILIGLLACNQTDNFKPTLSQQELYSQLKKIDSLSGQRRTNGLNKFFKNWNIALQANPSKFINQNDTLQAIYAVYKIIYRPFDLLTLGQWEWGNKLDSDCKYAVVQNKIYYKVLNTDTLGNLYHANAAPDSIVDFRPEVNLDKSKVLYLIPAYKKAIDSFLGAEETELGEGNIMNPSQPKGVSAERYEMLRPFIPILHGHDEGWILETSPSVYLITFNKSFTKAIVQFTVGYQGGEATLIKSNDNWVIEKSEATWIE